MEPFEKYRAPCKDFIFTLILLVLFVNLDTENLSRPPSQQCSKVNKVLQSFSNMTFRGTTLIAITELASYTKCCQSVRCFCFNFWNHISQENRLCSRFKKQIFILKVKSKFSLIFLIVQAKFLLFLSLLYFKYKMVSN